MTHQITQLWPVWLVFMAILTTGITVGKYLLSNATRADLKKGLEMVRQEVDARLKSCQAEQNRRFEAISEERREIWSMIRGMDKKLDDTRDVVMVIKGCVERMERNGHS